MFEKLLANLPYNPSLNKQIGFYARRLRHEEYVRKTGLVFITLAFLVQAFAFMNPPQTTTTYAINDLANADTAKTCDDNRNESCIKLRKSAANTTQNLSDANGTTAQPNDVIAYTLFAENKGQTDVDSFVMQESLSDVFEYADIVDLHGGTLARQDVVSWPAATIKSGSSLTNKVTVRVKNPLPGNTASASNPMQFDYIMTNVYGNSTNIKVPLPTGVSQVVALSADKNSLQASPTEGLLIVAAVVILASYFYARSRLLINESMIVLQESNSGSI